MALTPDNVVETVQLCDVCHGEGFEFVKVVGQGELKQLCTRCDGHRTLTRVVTTKYHKLGELK